MKEVVEKNHLKMIKKTIIILVVLYVIILLGFYFFQNFIIFQPKKTAQNYQYIFSKNFEEVNLKVDDNTTLNAIHFKVESPKGVILYFHGNRGNLERWGVIASSLTKYNYDVFVMDYRSYGKSTGKRTEDLMYDDAQFCYDYLKQTYSESNIVVYGRSLGGTFATYVASKNTPKQLILEATFSSLKDVIISKLPILPFSKILKFKFNTDQFISEVKCQVLIFHGRKDRLVSLKLAKKLVSHSNKDRTQFIEIDNATHHNINDFEIYHQTLELLFSE